MPGQEHRRKHRSVANLKPPWTKGHSGNPGGRPKGPSLSSRLRDLLDTKNHARSVLLALLKAAIIERDVKAIALIFTRVDGLPMPPEADPESDAPATSPKVDKALGAAIDIIDGKPPAKPRKKKSNGPKK